MLGNAPSCCYCLGKAKLFDLSWQHRSLRDEDRLGTAGDLPTE